MSENSWKIPENQKKIFLFENKKFFELRTDKLIIPKNQKFLK